MTDPDSSSRPPRLAEWLLSTVLPGDPAGRSVLGDLAEEFGRMRGRDERRAGAWYWRAALSIVARRAVPQPHSPSLSPRPTRSPKGDGIVIGLLLELRHAARALLRAPGFTIVAALTLALGIGANTAIFSVVNGVLITPLPYPESGRLVTVSQTAPGLGYDRFGTSPGLYLQYAEQSQTLESIALLNQSHANLTGDGEPERVPVVAASRNLLDVLRVPMLAGRSFTEQEDLPDGPVVAIISETLRDRRFGTDADVIGRSLEVNGVTREIVGVMPVLDLRPEPVELWLPAAVDPANAQPGLFGANSIGRLAPGATPEQTRLELNQLLSRLDDLYADIPQFLAFAHEGQLGTLVNPMKEDIVGDLEQPLWILLGTVGFVLLIVCANVANLFLVRAEARRREMAVRSALGARRGVLVRQYLMESVVLAAVGGAGGIGLAAVGVPLLLRLAPPDLPRFDQVGLDARVLAFAVGASALSALLFGLVPALRNSSPKLLPALKMAGRGTSVGKERQVFRSALVVTQTALALVLLVGSGLLVRSFWQLRNVDPGFEPRNLVSFTLTLPQARYGPPSQVAAFHDRLIERLSAIPGVVSASGAANVPFGGNESGTAHEVEDRPTEAGALDPIFWFTYAAPGYFETMRIPLLAGRTFEPRDHQQTPGSVIVSQAVADRLWPGEDALGQRIRFSGVPGWETVVGVVGSVHSQGLREPPTELVYYPMLSRQGENGWAVRSMGYTMRASNPEAVMASVRAAVRDVDPQLAVTRIGTVEEWMTGSVVEVSFTMIVLVVAAIMALLLGAIGLYGVLAYLVTQRRQEIGLRIALGARAGDVRAMVVRQGVVLAGGGVAIGLLGAFGLTRFMEGLLYGIAPFDPLSVGVTSAGLMGVVLAACYLPARRASRVDPMEALRVE